MSHVLSKNQLAFAISIALLIPVQLYAYENTPYPGNDVSLVGSGRSIRTTFLEPKEVSVVAAGEPGIVSDVLVKEGDRVEKGQQIGSLDQRVYKEILKSAQIRAQTTAKVDAARSALELQELRRQSFEKLAGGGHANKAEMDKIHLEFAAAQAALAIATNEMLLNQMEVSKIEAQLELRMIVSPLSGYVSSIHRNVGEYLPASEPKFATVVRLDQLKAKFFLNGSDLNSFETGTPITIYLPQTNKELKAQVTFVSPIVDPDSGTARIEVTLENELLIHKSGTICFLGSREEYQATNEKFAQHPKEINSRKPGVLK